MNPELIAQIKSVGSEAFHMAVANAHTEALTAIIVSACVFLLTSLILVFCIWLIISDRVEHEGPLLIGIVMLIGIIVSFSVGVKNIPQLTNPEGYIVREMMHR